VHPFGYLRADSLEAALGADAERAAFIAGGTCLVDLMRLGVMKPERLIDLNRLSLDRVVETEQGVSIGALVRNSALAEHTAIRTRYRALSEALLSGASPQLRNRATVGGNLMQRTRCAYFRNSFPRCNKLVPGSGCAAFDGENREHAILGGSEHCIAVHPSDMCVAMVAFEAQIRLRSKQGERVVPIGEFHLLPGQRPDVETVLAPGEIITEVMLPAVPFFARSRYVKARDRASYEFALASAAVALDVVGGTIRAARVALGGVGTKPWRSPEAEQILMGRAPNGPAFEEAARAALAQVAPRPHNAFKVVLAQKTLVRALEQAANA
jgi:xanthine dehydrogenase YagS FAD-binding subunit